MTQCVMKKDCCLWKIILRYDKSIVTSELALGASGPWKNRTATEFKYPSVRHGTRASHKSTGVTHAANQTKKSPRPILNLVFNIAKSFFFFSFITIAWFRKRGC